MARHRRFVVSRPVIWVSVCLVVALVAGLVVWRLASSDDDTAAPAVDLVPPPAGMVVGLERLGGGTSAVGAGSTVSFVASAAGQAPLAALELWAGDTRVDRVAVDGSTASRAAFEWPAAGGDVVVTARSIDIAGRSALSNPVRVRVVDAPLTGMASMVEHAVAPGDTLDSLAATYSTPASMIALANPGAFGADLVPTVATLQVPVPITAADVGATPSAPLKAPLRSARSIVPPPGVTVTGCTAVVSPTEPLEGTGLAAYVLPPDGEMFTMMASGPIDRPLSVPLPAGVSNLVLASFDAGKQTFGPVGALDTGEGCDTGWTGAVRLEGSQLIADVAADAAYLYVSDGSGWQRVPATGSVPRHAGAFDFTGLLPAFGNGAVDVEAWGRSGGQLVFLGAGHLDAGQVQVPPFPKFVRTQLWWVKSPATATSPEQLSTDGYAPDPGVLTFRWKTSTPLVTAMVWQVTSFSPPATAGIDLPGVLAQQVVTGNGGTFTIDFSKFAGKPQVPTASASSTLGAMVAMGGKVAVPSTAAQPAGPEVAVGAGGATVFDGGVVVDLAQTGDLPLLPTPTRFYVRAVPFIGEQFTGRASNDVAIDTKMEIDPSIFQGGPVGQPGSNVYDLSLTVKPPKAANPWMARCWMITEIDPLQFDPQYSYLYPWFIHLQKTQYAGTVCPLCYATSGGHIDFSGYYGFHCAEEGGFDLFDPSTYGDFPLLGPLISGLVKVGSSVWDFAVQLATYLKSHVVEFVSLVGCQSFVKAGSAAAGTATPDKTAKWCGAIAEAAVDAALISAGIPPTLPTFEQAVQAMKGDLVDLVVQQATALGIPCDEADLAAEVAGDDTLTCAGLAGAALDLVVDAAKTAVTASAQSVSGIFFPPGVTAVPHPNGLTTPPSVTISVLPTPAAPFSGITCPATVVMTSAYFATPIAAGLTVMPDLNNGYDTQLGLWNGLWVKGVPYTGFVVQPTKIQLPSLPTVGGVLVPATTTFVLSQLAPHDDIDAWAYSSGFLPNSSASIQRQVKIPYASVHLHPGASLVTTVNASCAGDTTVIGTILPGQQLNVTKVLP